MRAKVFRYGIIIIAAAFLLFEIMVNMFINAYVTSKTSLQMSQTVQSLASSIEDNDISVADMAVIVNYYELAGGAYIVVFDAKGNVKMASRSGYEYLYGHNLPEHITEKILSGKNVSILDDFNNIFDAQVIVYGEPIDDRNTVSGGVLAVLPQPQLSVLKWELHRRMLLGMIISIIFASFMAYIISKQITKPIRKINNALKELATGDFKYDLELDGDLKPLAATFNDMAKAIKNSDRVGKEFLANVSHELRTPMTTITGFLQGIEDGTIPEEKHKEYINIVISEMKRLTRLTNGLLEVARMDSRKEEFTTEIFDINELVRISLLTFESRIEEKELQVRIEFETEKLSVDANRDGITRVITNLLDNAVKFADRGGYIMLKTNAKGDDAIINIENSGDGIPKSDLDFIFDRFHKSDKSRSMDKKGVGLGLYIVKNILLQHGKKIIAESEEGKFTRFTFNLKRVK